MNVSNFRRVSKFQYLYSHNDFLKENCGFMSQLSFRDQSMDVIHSVRIVLTYTYHFKKWCGVNSVSYTDIYNGKVNVS